VTRRAPESAANALEAIGCIGDERFAVVRSPDVCSVGCAKAPQHVRLTNRAASLLTAE
jgi:hypothetical protein